MREALIVTRALFGLLLGLVLAGCLPPPQSPPASRNDWAAALRALDPPDAAAPAHDLIAAYLRLQDDALQIRVDLLAFQHGDDLSLNVEIGDDAHPEAAPLLIRIPAAADSARLTLDPHLATVIVTLPRWQAPARPRVDVTTPEDALTGLRLDDPPPTQTAPLLLTFYDTFSARFPAEALRRWDGAHSGPRGERHGLKYLLDAAETCQIPIVLLDLKTPENLSALDAMGLLPRIRRMQEDGLLLLPDQPGQQSLFGLPASPFVYGETPASTFTFAASSDARHLYRPLLSHTTIIPIAIEDDTSQPTPDGPSLDVRRAMIETALNEDENDLLILGGSLRNSTWGSPGRVEKMLSWFASRPYIQVLTVDDLQNLPARPGRPEIRSLPRDQAYTQLEAHYQRLVEPVRQFIEQWEGAPLATCADDLDGDQETECVLATDNFLALFDARGARLTYWFSLAHTEERRSLQQLIGPSWQEAVGLSEPSRWDLSKGEGADPGAYPGAFTDLDEPFEMYRPAIVGDTLVFTALDGNRIKTFRLREDGLEVSYEGQGETVMTQIPLLVEPNTRFTPGWTGQYVRETFAGEVAWGLAGGPVIRIQAQGQVRLRAFDEALPFLTAPEDPDFPYPAGHYVPFPMAIVDVRIQPGAVVVVTTSVVAKDLTNSTLFI